MLVRRVDIVDGPLGEYQLHSNTDISLRMASLTSVMVHALLPWSQARFLRTQTGGLLSMAGMSIVLKDSLVFPSAANPLR